MASASSIGGRSHSSYTASIPRSSKAACCIAPDSEWATGWPIRTTRFVMPAPLRVRGRSPDTEIAALAGASIGGLARGDQAGDGERHGQAMVVQALDRRADESGRAVDDEVVAVDRDPGAEGAQTRGDPGDRDPIPCGAARPRRGSSCRPRAWVAARQRTGISSIAAATSAGETSIASRPLERTVRSASGSPTPSSAASAAPLRRSRRPSAGAGR